MSRHDNRNDRTRYVFAAADFATTVHGARITVTRGQRYSTDDPVVETRPDLFRAFTPPPTED